MILMTMTVREVVGHLFCPQWLSLAPLLALKGAEARSRGSSHLDSFWSLEEQPRAEL